MATSAKASRITGEPCCHVEWRITGRVALKAAGITNVADLLSFDHHEFWQRRLLIAEWDLQKLGRLTYHEHLKRRFKGKQKKLANWIEWWGNMRVDMFRQRAITLIAALPKLSTSGSTKARSDLCSVQDVLDAARREKGKTQMSSKAFAFAIAFS